MIALYAEKEQTGFYVKITGRNCFCLQSNTA